MTPPPLPSTTRIRYSQDYRRCGKAGCHICQPGGPGHGPYWVARWTADGRRHKQYLGRTVPPVLDAVSPVLPSSSALSGPEVSSQNEASTAVHPTGVWIQVLGGFAVWQNGRRIPDAAWRRRQAGTVVKCLLAAPLLRLRRDELIEMLWPDAGEEGGDTPQRLEVRRRNTLRVSLHAVRRVLEGGATPGVDALTITTDGDLVALAVRPFGCPDGPVRPLEEWLDAARFHRAARRALEGGEMGACQAALALYGGLYLPDDLNLDAHWTTQRIAGRRREMQRLCVAVHLHLASLHQAAERPRAAEEHWRAALDVDRTREDVAATLMRFLIDAGRRGEALDVYNALAEAVRQGRGAEPAPPVADLRAAILEQNAARRDAASSWLPPPLPQPQTPFIGRRMEQEEVRTTLARMHLLTLTGMGGCGKSRLALAVAASIAAEYPDGVCVADLAEVADPALVVDAVAAAVGLREEPGQPLLTTLARGLHRRRLLLVLDNCEGQIAACARVADRLLRDCLDVRLLATSREPLGLPDEARYRVQGLALPTSGTLPIEQLAGYDAIALFVARAQARRPDFRLTAQNAEAVRQICAALGGVALAIELAAARITTFSPAGLALQLGESLRVLTEPAPGVAARHRTLRATLDWSYALLTEAERLLLSRLSIFAGGCTAEAATAVCAGGGVRPDRVTRLLFALADKSLVHVDTGVQPARFTLLEPVRQYGAERCAERGEDEALGARHRAWFAGWIEGVEPALRGPEQLAWLDRVEAERDNVRRVLDVHDGEEADAALRVAAALWHYWDMRAPLSEGRRWVEGALARAERTAPAYGQAAVAAGRLAAAQRDDAAADAHFHVALSVACARADDRVAALALLGLAGLALRHDDAPRALRQSEESLCLWRAVGDPWGEARAIFMAGRVTHNRGRFEPIAGAGGSVEKAATLYREALALLRQTGDRWGIACALTALGDAALDAESYDEAAAWYGEALDEARELGDDLGQAAALFALGLVAYAQQRFPAAAEAFSQSARLAERIGARYAQAQALQYLADSADWDGLNGTAAAYLHRAEELFREIGDELAAIHVQSGHAWLALTRGDAAHAERLADGYIARMRGLGNNTNIVFGLYFLGGARLRRGDVPGAIAAHRQGLELLRSQFRGWFRRHGTYAHLFGLAQALAERGQLADAARLLGAADGVNEPIHRPILSWERPSYQRALDHLYARLGETEYTRLWTEGRTLTMDAAMAEALRVSAAHGEAARDGMLVSRGAPTP